jgi:hypothetical protein
MNEPTYKKLSDMEPREIAEELYRIYHNEFEKRSTGEAWQAVATAVFLELHSCKCRTRYWEGEVKRLERGEKPIEPFDLLMEKYKNLKLTESGSLDISQQSP